MTRPITDAGLLHLLWEAGQLCQVCAERLWTQRAQWHPALICAACAEGEPTPAEEAWPLDTLLAVLIFCVLVAMLWDIRRTQLRGQASLERIEESAERIAQLTAEVLRRTPAP